MNRGVKIISLYYSELTDNILPIDGNKFVIHKINKSIIIASSQPGINISNKGKFTRGDQ